jgi:hypothetical protein
MNKAGTKVREGHRSVTPSGVIYKSKSKSKDIREDYTYNNKGYGDAFRAGGAFIKLPIEAIEKLVRARVINHQTTLALLLHRQADVRAWPVVKLPIALLNRLGFDRRMVSRALQQLESKGVVRVHRKPGSRSTVTLLRHPIRHLCFVTEEDEEDEL